MAKGGFVYRGKSRTADDVTKKAKEGTRDYDSIYKPGLPIFKPKEGENQIRILPSTWEEPDWDLTIYSHYDVGPDRARYLCLEHEPDGDGRCPVCEARAQAADEDEADALRQAKGAVCWIIDRDDEKAGPQLWSIPFTKIRNEIHARSLDKRTREPILIDDPEEGYDITFFRKGTDTRTQYTGVEVARDPSPLHENEKIKNRWLDYISEHPLPECLNYYPYEHIKKALYGKAIKRDDDEDESPRRRRLAREEDEEDTRSSRYSRRSRSEPEDEEEEAPRSSRRSRAAREDEDDEVPFDRGGRVSRRRALLDDEPEDKEEEPEEAAPSKGARRILGRLRPPSKR